MPASRATKAKSLPTTQSKSSSHSSATLEISIILSAFKRSDLLVHALQRISEQDFPQSKWELIVIDDAQSQDNKRVVESFQKKIKNLIFISPGHQGSAKARMHGFSRARGNILAFTDEDTLPQKDWLSEIANAFQKYPHAVGIEGKVITDEKRSIFSNAPQNLRGGIYIGCNTHYRKSVIDAFHGYDPDFYFWREDTDIAFHALERGEIVFVPSVVMYHPAKAIAPISIINNLRFVKDDFILFRHFPKRTLHFLGREWAKNFVWSAIAYAAVIDLTMYWNALAAGTPLIAFPPIFAGLLAYAVVRGFLSLRNKQFSLSEGFELILFSLPKDLLYPWYWVGYALWVVVLGQPPQDRPRTSQ